MRSTMQTITNVNYAGRAVDTTDEQYLTFTNNCDSLSYVRLNVRDSEGNAWSTSIGDGLTMSVQRGQTVRMSPSWTAGQDYTVTPVIYQSVPNVSQSSISPGKYDVYMGSGRVQADSAATDEIYIDKDISFIKAPIYSTGDTVLVGGCAIQLSDRTLLITDYDPETGLAEVAAANINGTTGTLRLTTQGEPYKLITNYLVCDTFAFSARALPSLSLAYEISDSGVEVTGTYSQAQGVALQSWKMWATYAEESSDSKRFEIEHETQYTYTIEDIFPLIASDGETQLSAPTDIYCEVTTQDGVTVQEHVQILTDTENKLTVTATSTMIQAAGLPDENCRIFVFRHQNYWQREQGGGTPTLNFAGLKYIGDSASYTESSGTYTYNLYTAETGHNATYQFIVVGIDSNGYVYYGKSADVNVPEKTWSLQHLVKTGYRTYRTEGVRYDFAIEVSPGNIETVTDSKVYGTESRFPKYVKSPDRYDTGSFTAVLGSIHAQEASAHEIATWAEFIAQGGAYLLKTDSGDVKIVAITGNPARQYGASLAELGITKVTYTWTEIDSADTAVIR